MSECRALRFALAGWQGSAWAGSYFPADLPQDWRLSYFANENDALFVPAQLWQQVPTAELVAWCDEVPECFRFYLELDPKQLCPNLDGVAESMAENLGGILLSESRSEGVNLIHSALIFPQAESNSRKQKRWTKSFQQGEKDLFCVFYSPKSENLREIRADFEIMLPCLKKEEAVVVVTGAFANPSLLMQLRTLAELLGYD